MEPSSKRTCKDAGTQTETPPPSPSVEEREKYVSTKVNSDYTDKKLGVAYRSFFAHFHTAYSIEYLWGWDVVDKAQATPIFKQCPELGNGWIVDTVFLRELCEPSKFGSGDQTLFDTSVRDSVELKLTPKDQEDLSPYIWDQVVRIASDMFGKAVDIEIDKLVVYGPGGHFEAHRDTLRAENHIGTVVFTFGNKFEGGEFECPLETTFEPVGHSEKGSTIAFYTDTLHRVAEVKSGERVSLTFRVFAKDTALIKLPGASALKLCEEKVNKTYYPNDTDGNGDAMDGAVDLCGTADYWTNRQADLRAKLNPWPKFEDTQFVKELNEELNPENGYVDETVVVFQCNHFLPRKHNGVRSLRGVDRTFAAKLIEAGYAVNVTKIEDEQEYHIPDKDFEVQRSTFVKLPPVFGDNPYVILVRLQSPETDNVDDDEPTWFTGNESAPGFLQYTTCGLVVSRPRSGAKAQSPLPLD